MNTSTHFAKLFSRDLQLLRKEIENYEDEANLWLKKGQINNSSGNLALHICGNLKHFIGAVLLEDGYKRDREFEFGAQLTRENILSEIDETQSVVSVFFRGAKPTIYDENYPLEVFGFQMSTHYFIVHLHGHLNYHLGQINYHRRILEFG